MSTIDSWVEKPFSEILSAFHRGKPLPAAVGASIFSAAIGCSLGAKAARVSKGNPTSSMGGEGIHFVCAKAEEKLVQIAKDLIPIEKEDGKAVKQILRFLHRFEKGERGEEVLDGLDHALKDGIQSPFSVLLFLRDGLEVMAGFVDVCDHNLISDLATGAHLCMAAGEGLFLVIQSNAQLLRDRDHADGALEELSQILPDLRASTKKIHDTALAILQS
jgi:formiminotetrahydrofolate cyclodeaminase